MRYIYNNIKKLLCEAANNVRSAGLQFLRGWSEAGDHRLPLYRRSWHRSATEVRKHTAEEVASGMRELARLAGKPGMKDINEWTYLGDGVYGKHDGWGILLHSNSHDKPTDKIYIEPQVLTALNALNTRIGILLKGNGG